MSPYWDEFNREAEYLRRSGDVEQFMDFTKRMKARIEGASKTMEIIPSTI